MPTGDLRSSLVKAACSSIRALGAALGAAGADIVAALLPHLAKRVATTIQARFRVIHPFRFDTYPARFAGVERPSCLLLCNPGRLPSCAIGS